MLLFDHNFSKEYLEDTVFFVGTLIPLFWTFDEVYTWFQNQTVSLTCILPSAKSLTFKVFVILVLEIS